MSFDMAVKAISCCVTTVHNMKNVDIQNQIVSGLDEVLNKLDELNSKSDILIIRELIAANKMLDDMKSIGNCDPNELSHLKGMYMLNTGIPDKGSICGLKNTEIILMSYLGLFQVGVLTGESDKLLTRYVLHMFETGEAIVATKLFPQFCQEVFYPYYREAEGIYLTKMENWRDEIGPYDGLINAATGALFGIHMAEDNNGKLVHPKKQLRRDTAGALLGLAVGYGLSKTEIVRKFTIQQKLKKEWLSEKIEICKNASKVMLSNQSVK